ncbi:MAG: PD-(D/E)XK nuclease family protein [Clostridia bacterium]|nr:PD-(D/E)XK nuclease family protein [Clostridia bacterium]
MGKREGIGMKKVDLIASETYAAVSGEVMRRLASCDKFEINRKKIIIVPDSVSLSSEIEVMQSLGGSFNIRVLTFGRLMRAITGRRTLNKQAEIIALTGVVAKNKDKLTCFKKGADSYGFVGSLFKVINQLKYSRIAPDTLVADNLPPSLQGKLADIRLLYSEYDKFLKGNFYADADAMELLYDEIPFSSLIALSDIYIKDFDSFSKQNLHLISRLAEYAASLTVAVVMSTDLNHNVLFLNEAYNSVKAMCAKNGFAVDEYVLHTADPLRAYIGRYLLNPSIAWVGGKVKPIETLLFTFKNGANAREEVVMLADYIAGKTVNDNYGDFTVIVSDLAAYSNAIEEIFPLYGIPYFADVKERLISHPAANYLTSLLSLYRSGFSENAVLCFVRSPFFPCAEREVTDFINYSSRYKIAYNLEAPFAYGKSSEEYENAERVRMVLNELVPKDFPNTASGEVYVELIKRFIEKNGLYEKLEKFASEQEELGLLDQAAVTVQVGEKLEGIFESLRLLGGCSLSLEEFYTLFVKGATSCEVSVLSALAGCVTFTDMGKARSHIMRDVCVLGANEGVFPQTLVDLNLLNDENLRALGDRGIEIEPSIRTVNQRQRLEVYQLFCGNYRSMYVSYSSLSGEERVKPALAVKHLLKMLIKDGKPMEVGFIDGTADLLRLKSRKAARRKLLEQTRKYLDGGSNDLTQIAPLYFALGDVTPEQIDEPPFVGKISDGYELYRRHSTSLSRVECFYTCPYKHFLKYGIKIYPPETGEPNAADIGQIIHGVLEQFIKRNRNNRYIFLTLDEKRARQEKICDDLIDEEAEKQYAQTESQKRLEIAVKEAISDIFKEIIDNDEFYRSLLRDDRYRTTLSRIKAECAKLALLVVGQINRSLFFPKLLEYKFGRGAHRITVDSDYGEYELDGVIDRIDVYGEKAIIIDYKTGRVNPEVKSLDEGRRIQLTSYLLMAEQLGYECCGLYYMPLSNDYGAEGTLLRGITLNKRDTLREIDCEFDSNGKILGIKLNKDGSINKNCATKVAERAEMEALGTQTADLIRQALNRSVKGDIAVRESADCKYCEYAFICRRGDASYEE